MARVTKEEEKQYGSNWQAAINQAVSEGRMQDAARFEQARNDKINSDSYTGKQTTTNKYSAYLDSGSSSGGSSGGGTTQKQNTGIYGVPIIEKAPLSQQQGFAVRSMPDMGRRQDLAGSYATSGGYTVFYDDMGYATKAIKGHADYVPHMDLNAENGSYNNAGAWTDNEMLTEADRQKIASIRADPTLTGDQKNALANEIRAGYGYTIDKSGYVTDLFAKSQVDAQREKWGLPVGEMSAAQSAALQAMFPELETSDPSALLGAMDALGNGRYDPNGSYGSGNDLGGVDLDSLFGAVSGGYGGGSFGGGAAPEYEGSKWDAVLDELAQQLLGMNYEDWTKGDQYAALANRYGNQGRMSMQDVLGQISSRTGGLASSYATTAAQQQYNEMMAQLEEVARTMYDADRGELLDEAQMARQYSEDDYNRFLDRLGQWNSDRDFQYGVYRDSVDDQRYADALEYERMQNESDIGYTRDQASRAEAQDRINSYLAAGGSATELDADLLAASGYTASEIAAQERYYAQQAAAAAKKSSEGSSGGSGSGKPRLTLAQAQKQAENGQVTDAVISAIDYYLGDGAYEEFYGEPAEEPKAGNFVHGNNDYWLGDGSTAGGKTSLNWDQDEGIFTWNGRNYSDVNELLSAIESASLSSSEMTTLKKKFKQFGFDLG